VFASLILTQWRAGVRLKPLRPVFASVTLLLLAAVLFAAHGDLPALEAAVPRWSIAVLCVGLLALCGRTMRDSRAYLKSRRMENFEP
jgi:hypothetical protein